ncbi:MAG: molecular chaperone HtpG [Myxococcales bacterium]
MSTENAETHRFEADVNELLRLVINSLYSHKEIFLRELVSNSFDALEKLRFRAVSEPDLLAKEPTLEIRIQADKEKGTLTLEDTGVGMTHDELAKNLGTIAHSGSRAFFDKLKDVDRKDMTLIGQFGVGFYSAYLVADHVEVTSLAAGEHQAHRWSSDAKETYALEPARRVERGTSVTLHLKSDQKQFLEDWTLRDLVTRYSDYVSHPIKLRVETKKDNETTVTWETLNRATALWQRTPGEVTKEQYEEFYKHITHDFEAPIATAHFRFEGTQLFSGILFVPRNPPFDLMMQSKRGVRLYVKRVFIMEDCDELLPPWLRFVRGVIDSDDLPLNVSRELLQDSAVTRIIKKQVTKKTLERLEQLATESVDDYAVFWEAFGAILKEGLALDFEHRERLTSLVRFRSTLDDKLTSLADYRKRMKEDQKAIYYALGDSIRMVSDSPHLEALRKRGYEVLLMSDPVDEWAVDTVREYDKMPFVSAMRSDLKIEPEDQAQREATTAQLKPLCDKVQQVLGERVQEVRISDRLTDSPCCLVLAERGHHAPVEKLLRASGREMAPSKRIFEVNATHAIVDSLRALVERNADLPMVSEWIETLYDQAVLSEGGKLEDPARFAKRITALLQEVAGRQAKS